MKAGYSHSGLCKSLLLMEIVEISCIIVLNNIPSGPLGKYIRAETTAVEEEKLTDSCTDKWNVPDCLYT
jgi:hypothetical protein